MSKMVLTTAFISAIVIFTTFAQALPAESEVDQLPLYAEGGMANFYQFIQENLQYPKPSRRKCHQGISYVQFIVTKTGRLDSVYTLNSIDHHIDTEAVRAVKLTSGKWQPGEKDKQPVNVKMILPLTFRIGGTCRKRLQKAIKKGVQFYDQKEYSLAMDYLEVALSMDPSDPTALVKKGLTHLALDQKNEACKAWKAAFLSEEAQQLLELHCSN